MSTGKAGHRSDEITSYLSETLEPRERAAFEAHLEECEECRQELAAQKALFARANEALAVKPKRTIEEQVARFEKMVAAERTEKKRWRAPPLAIRLAAAAAVAALGIWEWVAPQAGHVVVGAPRRPQNPAGSVIGRCDGGGSSDGGCGNEVPR
jgi:anti-sigma factor RsiW